MELQKVEKGFRPNPSEPMVVTPNPRERDNVSDRFTFTILKCFTISIYKPLVTLKLALLLYFQATCTAIFAVISDKFGKAKILLILNLIITGASIAVLNYVLLSFPECNNQSVVLHYDPENATWISNVSLCEKNETEIYIDACHTTCLNESSNIKSNGDSIVSQSEAKNLPCTSSVAFRNLQVKNELCSVSFNSSHIEDAFQCNNGCNISCTKADTIKCAVGVEGRKVLVVIYIIIITIFLTTFVNSYRFFDITAMILVKEHQAEYGLVRLWAILGALIGPPMAGFVVELASVPGGKANYAATFYLFCGSLSSNCCHVLFLMGLSWGFRHFYKNWFLAELNTSVVLLSVIEAAQSLYGIPFSAEIRMDRWKVGRDKTILVAVIKYCILITPDNIVAIVNSTAGSIHFTIGRITGGFFGEEDTVMKGNNK
ncbi:hypothetical protein CEXT_329961 [Caerostris extrusa]|uniref:Major facilitator superfamily associated domain-containing protein n=1 Tax=Caerostris extrusa TaxID=172846 RepID=A0AAV4XG24_CAEEX|nr:hypothetical protein CEXT_329961 [Caerostris extrusa]